MSLQFKLMIFAVIILLSLGLGIYYIVHHYLAYSAICPRRVDRNNEILRFPSFPPTISYRNQFTVVTRDSIRLSCEYYSVEQRIPKATIILVHGISSCKEHMYGIAEWLLSDYDIIVYDQRAHGQSEGKFCTFGAKEKLDISDIINKVESDSMLRSSRLGIMGFSLGAAVAMQAMAQESRIQCGIFEGGFASFRETYHDYGERMIQLRIPSFTDYVLTQSERLAQFSVDTVCPEKSVASIHAPVLFIHGEDDKHIPVQYAKRNYAACGSSKKKLHIVKDAQHHDLGDKGGTAYRDIVLSFLHEVFEGNQPKTKNTE